MAVEGGGEGARGPVLVCVVEGEGRRAGQGAVRA